MTRIVSWNVNGLRSAHRYSGVAIHARRQPDSVESSLGVPAIDDEARVVRARFGALTIVNAYS